MTISVKRYAVQRTMVNLGMNVIIDSSDSLEFMF